MELANRKLILEIRLLKKKGIITYRSVEKTF